MEIVEFLGSIVIADITPLWGDDAVIVFIEAAQGGRLAVGSLIPQPGAETPAIPIVDGRPIAEFLERGSDIKRGDGGRDALAAVDAGTLEDERHLSGFAPESLFADVIFLTDVKAMITVEHHDGVFGVFTVFERIEHATDHVVDKAEHRQIGVERILEFTRAFEHPVLILILRAFGRELLSLFRDAGPVGLVEVLRDDQFFGIIEIEESLRRIPREVGVEESAGEEEGGIVGTGQKFGGVVHRMLIAVFRFIDGQGAPIEFVHKVIETVQWVAGWRGGWRDMRVVDAALPIPGIIKDLRLIIVPLVRRIETDAVMKDLPGSDGTVTLIPKTFG